MSRFLYTLLLYLILPFTPLKLLWRGIRQPEYRQHWAERYGFYHTVPDKPIIWLHCVSVGETRAAEPLIKNLIQQYPEHQVLITHATPTGRRTSEQLFGERVLRAYLPYDVPGAVNRFLTHFKPVIGMLMETELWFNLIAACQAQQIAILLVNARLSEKSARGYARVAKLTKQALKNLSAATAQTTQDAERLKNLGADHVEITGNLKFDVTPPADAIEQGEYLRNFLGKHRPVFLAASTRDGEEAMILEAIKAANINNLLTIIVPRHPQRFDEVARLINQQGFSFFRRSETNLNKLTAHIHDDIMLGDTMGEMFTYYAACDVALIGGSLMPLGGQNLIEAFVMKKPVIVGEHTFNFEWVANEAVRNGAAIRVQNTTALSGAMNELFTHQDIRVNMGSAAYQFSKTAGGATQKTMQVIYKYMAKN